MQRQWESTGALQMAALAHDLRTPMCVAVGAAQMALEAGGKDVSAQLQQILQAVRAMDGMIMCAAGEQRNAGVSGSMLDGELRAVFAPKAAEKMQRLSIDLSDLGESCMLDSGALSRVLANLLSNAIKYTPNGGEISLRAQKLSLPWQKRATWIRFVVADNGMGMSGLFMRKMYRPFVRAQESAHQPGRGLGLVITRRLVRAMGGFIRVKSAPGKGTMFAVTVPLKRI